MKKRIVCVLLTLIMLLSLVPMGASAASHEVSAAAITVLKQMTTLKTTCYYFSGSEFRTGYGTVCEEDHHFNPDGTPKTTGNTHTMTEIKADAALRKALLALDEKVNSFASANGLSLKQNQHDALVVFSYNAGTGWMNGNGVVKSVIINKGTANELLNAMAQWSKENANGNATDMSRRQVEVNMYFNGIYSNTAPTRYGAVVYNPDGGTLPQKDYDNAKQYTYHFDLNKEIEHPAVPTKAGNTFLGWYRSEGSVVAWVPLLIADCDGDTLKAKWQKNNVTSDNAAEVNYVMHRSHLSSSQVYKKVTDTKANDSLTKKFAEYREDNDNMFWVDRDYIDAKGTRWTRLRDIGGWVKVGAGSDNDSFEDSTGTVIATATVTANGYLNLRQEAGTDAAIIGALAKNDTVNIYEIKTVNGHQWGRSASGWLCLTYTRLILKDDVSISDAGRLAYAFTGKVTKTLDVHVEPGKNTNIVEYYVPHPTKPTGEDQKAELSIPKDTAVTVTNLVVVDGKAVDGETWAKVTWQNPEFEWVSAKKSDVKKTRSGWINMSEVVMDTAEYTVAADSVSVRNGWGDAANLIMSLNKGVRVTVYEIKLIGENIWGRIQVKDEDHVADGKTGYVNLASKYFSRDGAPVVEEEAAPKKLVATVVGTDALKVRKTGATYGQQIGRLTRGTTVAVWEEDDGWYKVDSNKNGTYDYKEDGWCSGKYLDIHEETTSSTVTDSNGNSYTTDGSGKGIVANTYSGVNVRTGPGTGYGTNGKLLPGTVVDILETKNGGKWGRVTQGWISMDYVTMISYNEVIEEDPSKGTAVESYDKADKTTTTAVYTGKMRADATVYRIPTKDEDKAEVIRNAGAGDNVTIYELAKVTENIVSDKSDVTDSEGNTTTTTTTKTTTTYWARINDGWVQNPETTISLDALDEKVHTQTGVTKLNVRRSSDENADNVFDVLVQGDQVSVTALEIVKDKVWGRIDTAEGTGWIRLDYMSEGAVYVKAPVQNNNTNTNQVVLGNTSSVGGHVTNSSGYRYTGKIIRSNEVNVRANPSTTASKTTTLKKGQALVVYETTVADNMAWGRCDAGWVYLYYVDLTPVVNGAVDSRVVYNDNTIIYSDVNCTSVAGTYARMSTIDIYEIVGKMARTEQGWVNVDNLL